MFLVGSYYEFSVIVGVIIAYITGGMPQQVTVDWQLFTDQIQQVPATATDQVSVARAVLMAGELNDQQAQQLLQALLKNVYRALDFREEDDVYDKLALSVEGDLLAEIYLQNRKSFAVQKAGGVQAKVKDVDIQHVQAERQAGDTPTYAICGQWTATGTVGHWGHVHTRRNQYDAIVTVKADQGDWKISGLELLEEQRIDPAARTDTAAR